MHRLWCFVLCITICFGVVFTAQAAGLQISPISLSLSVNQRAGAFTLGNMGKAQLTAQVRVFRWTQGDQGEEILQPTDAVIVSPPMVKIAPQSEQQFRVIRAKPSTAGAAEEAYRLIVDELPAPSETPKKGLRLVLRYSVPLFLNSTENPEAKLQWRIEPSANGKSTLVVSNIGVTRAQLAGMWLTEVSTAKAGNRKKLLDLEKEVKQHHISQGLFGYVFPGQTMRRIIPVSAAVLRKGIFTAVVNSREIQPKLEFTP